MGQLVVRTNGQTLLLTAATNPAGSTVGVWSDSGLSSAVTLPATVTGDTTYYLRDGDTTITVTQPDGSVVFSGAVSIGAWPREVTPVPTNPQVWADVAGLSGTYAPLVLSAAALTAQQALAEKDALTGVVPSRMATAPTVLGPTKGSGITGTPTVSAGGAGYAVNDTITLAGGTALSAAILTVSAVSGGAVTAVTVYRNGSYTSTPGNPVSQASTSGGGSGATFTVSWSANGQSTSLNRQTIGPTDSRFRFTGNGPTNLSASGFYGNTTENGTHSIYEWATDSQRVDIPMIGLNTTAVLFVNGQQVAATSLQTDVSGTQYLYAVDLGSSAWREFKLVAFNGAFGGVRLDGTATLTAPLSGPRPLAWSLGDSYTLSTGAANAGSQHIMVMAEALGLDLIPDGVTSTGWNSSSGNVPATRVANKLNALTRQVDYVFLDLGYNDAGGSMTTAAAAFDAAYTAIKASSQVKATTKYFCFGPATPLGRTANLDLVRDMLSARCTAKGDVRFIDVGDWVNSTNKSKYTGVDNIHPTPLGHAFLGARRAVAVQPYL